MSSSSEESCSSDSFYDAFQSAPPATTKVKPVQKPPCSSAAPKQSFNKFALIAPDQLEKVEQHRSEFDKMYTCSLENGASISPEEGTKTFVKTRGQKIKEFLSITGYDNQPPEDPECAVIANKDPPMMAEWTDNRLSCPETVDRFSEVPLEIIEAHLRGIEREPPHGFFETPSLRAELPESSRHIDSLDEKQQIEEFLATHGPAAEAILDAKPRHFDSLTNFEPFNPFEPEISGFNTFSPQYQSADQSACLCPNAQPKP